MTTRKYKLFISAVLSIRQIVTLNESKLLRTLCHPWGWTRKKHWKFCLLERALKMILVWFLLGPISLLPDWILALWDYTTSFENKLAFQRDWIIFWLIVYDKRDQYDFLSSPLILWDRHWSIEFDWIVSSPSHFEFNCTSNNEAACPWRWLFRHRFSWTHEVCSIFFVLSRIIPVRW